MKNTAWILVVPLLLFVICISPESAFASIVINEFASDTEGTVSNPDWIELYNNGSESVDLGQYRLRDDSSTNKLDLSGTMIGNSFTVLEWSNKLNKTGDKIVLVSQSDESHILDLISYGDAENASVPAPSSNGSVGRKQDNDSEWVLFQAATKNSSNNAGSVVVPPTPTQTVTPTPTRTPTPQKTPTPTKVPTTTKIPTPIKVVTVTKTPTGSSFANSHEKAVLAETTHASNAAWGAQPTAMLQVSEAIEEKLTPTPDKKILVKNAQTFPVVELFFFGGAGLCILCAILIFLKQRKSIS